MSFATRLVLPFALLASLPCAPAHASNYEVGASLVCDTPAQVERFVALSAAMHKPLSGLSMPRNEIPAPA
jgi:hypothetical protein